MLFSVSYEDNFIWMFKRVYSRVLNEKRESF